MKRLKIITIILSVVIFFLGNANLVQATSDNKKIHKNIYIENIDVSNLTKEDAQKKIYNFLNKNKQIKLVNGSSNYILNLDNIEVSYDIKESIDCAYNLDKNKDFLSNAKTKINLDLGKKVHVKLNKTYNYKKLNEFMDQLDEAIRIEPVNASIIKEENLEYKKEIYGSKLDRGKFKHIIVDKINNMSYGEVKIPKLEIKPKYLYEDLIKINAVLGSYETYFNPNIYNRVNNIKVGAEAINNIILSPEEEFSFNSYINSENRKGEFKKAPVIINGKLKDGLGGGICQVSTTLYNAALYAGLEITNVRNHSIPSSYISKGRDATISTGDIDLRFKNNFEVPIFITHKVYNDKIISIIYGSEECKKEIDVITELVKSVPYNIKSKNSKNLYEGEKSIYQKGRKGYKINTFRVYKQNGEEIKELIRENYYPPMDKIVIYGTKKKIENSTNSEII
ncbi:MAG: VanW family protein [Romboutsia sp.]|uniref:VanW family protein n=1 Tax=Romboutsia sp. TaxID=1965302 RepID=UPI003F2DF4EB